MQPKLLIFKLQCIFFIWAKYERNKQRKQEEMYSDSLSPNPRETKRFSAPFAQFSPKEEHKSEIVTQDSVQEFDQSLLKQKTKGPRPSSYQSPKPSNESKGEKITPPKSLPGSIYVEKTPTQNTDDLRVIKSIGRYDVDGELAAEEYPADFVLLKRIIENRMRKIKMKLNQIKHSSKIKNYAK